MRRCIQTLQLSAEEAKRLNGELVPMESGAGVRDRMGFTIRVPRGVVCAITPFNSPLNVVAHKVAPALAGGNAVVIKPSDHTPLSAVELCRVLIDAGLPAELLALVHGPGATIGRRLLADQRIAFYAFTGSTRVGREIQAAAGLRGVQLELGGIASTIVCHDADIERAIPRILNAGFRKAGRVCTSVQRLFVDRRIAGTFVPKLLETVRATKVGDPADPSVDHRLDDHARACRAGGVLGEGSRRRRRAHPHRRHMRGRSSPPRCSTESMTRCASSARRSSRPWSRVIEFDDLGEAVARANARPFGLSAGLFTSDLSAAMRTARALRFGGVHINEASSARVDAMPFGGVKDSGFGREGPAYAIREMTEERLITIAY